MNKHFNAKGETLLELIISLALFAMTIALLVTLIVTSQRIFLKNLSAQERFNAQINQIEWGKDSEGDIGTILKTDGTIDFVYNAKHKDGTAVPGKSCTFSINLLSIMDHEKLVSDLHRFELAEVLED